MKDGNFKIDKNSLFLIDEKNIIFWDILIENIRFLIELFKNWNNIKRGI